MNPYPASRGSAFGIRPASGSSSSAAAGSPENPLTPGGPQGPQEVPAAAPRTVQVTPENAATYGFDRIGSTINLDTGGIVNPFSGPADGQGGNRAARNAEVQARAVQTPNPVGLGYSQIMSDPRARTFNTQLANDPQYAWNVLNFERSNPNHSEVYGGDFSPTGTGGAAPAPTGPYTTTGIGNRTPAPATTAPTTSPSGGGNGSNPYPAGSPNAATWDYFNRNQGGGAGNSDTNLAAPATSATTQSDPPWAYSQTGSGTGSAAGYRAPTAPAPETASGSVTNAIMRRFNPRSW